MKSKLIAIALGSVAILAASTFDAWAAKASVAGGALTCLAGTNNVPKKQNAVKLLGTLAVDVTGVEAQPTAQLDGDVYLRLQKDNTVAFFRMHLVADYLELDNQALVCRVVNPTDANSAIVNPEVQAFVQAILAAFGLPSTSRLVITDSSVSNNEPSTNDRTIYLLQNPTTPFVDGAGHNHGGSIGDVVLYAQ